MGASDLDQEMRRWDEERWRLLELPPDPEWLEGMIGQLLAENEEARYETARQIARRGRWVMPRVAALAEEERPRLREMAAYLLGQVGYPDAKSPGFLIRYPDGIPTVLRLLKDLDEEVRTTAAYAMGFIQAPGTIPVLVSTAADPCPDVRLAVANALGSFHTTYWSSRLKRRYRSALRTALLRLMDDADEEVRNWATFGIHQGGHDTPETRARLWRAVEDPYIEVRAEAAQGLARFGDRGFAPRLEHLLLDDEYFHDCYFEAAEELGDPALLPAVEDAAARWQAVLGEGEKLSILATGAIERLQKAAEEQRGSLTVPAARGESN